MSADDQENGSIFRREALEASREGTNRLGGLLHLTPRWMDHAYRLLAVLALAGGLYLALARTHEYVSGPAVVGPPSGGGPELLVALPGPSAPLLQPGQNVSFRLDGFPHAYATARLVAVEPVLVDAATARRRLGAGVAPGDSMVVVVRARLASPDFAVSGERRPLFPGLTGSARVRTRSLPLVAALLPGFRHIAGGADDDRRR